MKKIIFAIITVFLLVVSCNSTKTKVKDVTSLEGTWELNYITGPRISFAGLYPNKKPTITFDLKENRISGNNGCNSYNGPLKAEGNSINFIAPMAVTRMACIDALGENTYMKQLQMVDSYSISADGKLLEFKMKEIVLMRFTKKLE